MPDCSECGDIDAMVRVTDRRAPPFRLFQFCDWGCLLDFTRKHGWRGL